MSAPDTNLDRQEKRHRPSLTGIAIAVGASAVIMIGVALWISVPREEQAAPDPAVPALTGEATQ